jgi:hypothetical protein
VSYYRLASSAVSGGIYGALTPIVALLLLEPSAYGLFSVVYLIFAFGVSLQYSIISEAWARARKIQAEGNSWTDYSTALSVLSALAGATALVAALTIPELSSNAWALAGAVLFALYRNGIRYHSVAEGQISRVLISDAAGIVAFAIALVAARDESHLSSVTLAWLAAGLAGSLVLSRPRLRWGFGLLRWSRIHVGEIRPLLLDSIFMDLGAIGTPFLLAGFMGATRFGIYRAVSNAALPVRLLIDPLRPTLGRMRPEQLFGRSVTALIASVSIVLAAASYFALTVVVPRLGFRVGTLSSLVEYAPATSIFVIGSLLGTVYYIACRTNASQRGILTGRVFQTLVVVIMPIAGYAFFNLAGAIWGFAISSVVSAGAWIALAYTARQG